MPEPNASASPEDDDAPVEAGDELQFDQAEFTTPAPDGPSCSFCKRSIDQAYYELGGKICCASCRQRVEAALRGGSRPGRVLRAFAFGTVAAIVGAVLYYAIVRMTERNWGIFAVVLGFMVGGAVRKGTGNRGGLFYQFLAVFLTYSAIAGMLSPHVVEALDRDAKEQKEADVAQEKPEPDPAKTQAPPQAQPGLAIGPAVRKSEDPPAPAVADPAKALEKTTVAVGRNDAKDANRVAEQARRPFHPAALVLILLVIFYASPVIYVVAAPISGLIFSFALWEAWKINKRIQLTVNGPFRVEPRGSIATEPEVQDDGG